MLNIKKVPHNEFYSNFQPQPAQLLPLESKAVSPARGGKEEKKGGKKKKDVIGHVQHQPAEKMSTKGREIYSQLTTTFTVLVSGEAMSFPAPHSYSPAASRVIAVMFIFSPVQVCLAEKGREKGTHVQTLLEGRGVRYGPKITYIISQYFRVFL